MPLPAEQFEIIQSFREWLIDAVAKHPKAGPIASVKPENHDREDHSLLATWWPIEAESHFRVAVRPQVPEVIVGVHTESRWRNEDLEDKVEETGDTMSEYLEDCFAEADLDWTEPPVIHARAEQKWFFFDTPLEVPSLESLSEDATRQKILAMLAGYVMAFAHGFEDDEE